MPRNRAGAREPGPNRQLRTQAAGRPASAHVMTGGRRRKGPISVAQRVVVTLSDDIDGGQAAETVTFAIDGKSYEIDLNPVNAKKLRKTLAPYVAAGRKQTKAGKHGKTPVSYRHTSLAPDPAAVRAWARSHQMDVPARGRIPKRVYEAFEQAS